MRAGETTKNKVPEQLPYPGSGGKVFGLATETLQFGVATFVGMESLPFENLKENQSDDAFWETTEDCILPARPARCWHCGF